MPRNTDQRRTVQARVARKEPSLAEKIIWKELRGNKLGFRFRREHPIGPYRLDFYCSEARLAVELDGEQHVKTRDEARDAHLASLGIETLRIPTIEFLGMFDSACIDHIRLIRERCEARIAEFNILE